MDRDQSQHLFREADERFRANDFQGALDRLESLNAAFPNQRRVMFPIVRALTRLSRYQEALDLNQQIIDKFNYEPAKQAHPQLQQQLMNSLHQQFDSGGIPTLETGTFNTPAPGDIPGYEADNIQTPSPTGFPQPDFNINLTPRPAPPPLPRQSASVNWAAWLIVAAIVATYVAVSIALARTAPFLELDEATDALTISEEHRLYTILVFYAFAIVVSFIAGIPGGYCALLVTNLRKYYDLYEDIKDVALYVLICSALNAIPYIGWIGVIIVLYNHYQPGILKFFVMCIIYNLVAFSLMILLSIPVLIAYFPRVMSLLE